MNRSKGVFNDTASHNNLLLVASFAAVIFACKPSCAVDDLRFEAALHTNMIMQGLPILVEIKVTNLGMAPASVQDPSIMQRTVEIEMSRDGRQVPPTIQWDEVPGVRIFDLAPGQTLCRDTDVGWLHPGSLPSGKYTLRIHFFPRKGGDAMVSATETIEITELPPAERAAFASYRKVIGAGEHWAVVGLGRAFLKVHNESVFADRVRMETAVALSGMSNYDESVTLYRIVTESEMAPQWMKQNALYRMASDLQKKGDIKAAISAWEQYDTQYNSSDARYRVKSLKSLKVELK